ncbi:unnamed protein product [Cladocopium goreaui]|uniref:Palmitoyltransferase n=1 Tax=Cladocopium goreaui TaxID=2562237 RepID=A0A9P1G1W8_9DINO|nr:unnamed protein product [Cladocopium goreaui]
MSDLEDEEMTCCEYVREDGEVRHILQCFCECNDLDSLADDCIKSCCEGRRLQGPALRDKLRRVCRSAAERARLPWPGGAAPLPWPGAWAALGVAWMMRRCMELSTWLPWVACWLLLGAGHLVGIHLLCLTLPLRSEYLVAWVLLSIMGLYDDYLHLVYPHQPWLWFCLSHLLLLEVLFSFAASVFLRPKQDQDLASSGASWPCKICGHSIHGRDHHCVWINQCVGSHNHRSFVLFLVGLTLLAWAYAFMLCEEFASARGQVSLPDLWASLWSAQRIPCHAVDGHGQPLEGAIYATAGGIFTMVLLIAQVVSISTGLTNQRRGKPRIRNAIQNWITWAKA